jgi:hypothetical protein
MKFRLRVCLREKINAHLEARVRQQESDGTDGHGKERPGMYNRSDTDFETAMEVL